MFEIFVKMGREPVSSKNARVLKITGPQKKYIIVLKIKPGKLHNIFVESKTRDIKVRVTHISDGKHEVYCTITLRCGIPQKIGFFMPLRDAEKVIRVQNHENNLDIFRISYVVDTT